MRYTVKTFVDAIPGSAGIITTIATRVGCDWKTAKKYIAERPTVKAAYDSECEKIADMAEAIVINSLTSKEGLSTAKWYLTMKARDRGYGPEQQVVVQIPGDWKEEQERLRKAVESMEE